MRTRLAAVLLGTLALLAAAAPARAADFTVDSASDVDDGDNGCAAGDPDECTLREAIAAANSAPGSDNINFGGAIPNGGAINVASALPQITGPTHIAPANLGFIRAELNGPGPSAGTVPGLDFAETADGSSVNAVAIADFDRGIVINGADDMTIQSTRIGVTATGTVDGNGNAANEGGIHLLGAATGNTIGADLAINVIAGNTGDGIELSSGASDTEIRGALVGTLGSSDATFGNGGHGIDAGGATNTTIVAGTISNNGGDGIVVGGPGATIRSTLVGVSGGSAGNGGNGVRVTGAGVATIGGPDATDGVTIVGNQGLGVQIEATAGGTVLQNSSIGVDGGGNALPALRNNGGGVFVSGSPNNRIGMPGLGNRIDNNGNEGVLVFNTGSSGNRIEANRIGRFVGSDLEGIRVGNGATGTVVGSPGAGNVVTHSGQSGIQIEGATTTGTVVRANLVGVDASGDPTANAGDGIQVTGADGTVIGGVGAGEGNVVAGNDGDGVDIRSGADDTRVVGNVVGTNAAGTLALPNDSGVQVGGARGVVERNSIAGNVGDGLEIDDVDAVVRGNRIGRGASGATIPNGRAGIVVEDGSATVGGAGGASNAIVGNLGAGIEFDDSDARATIGENEIVDNGGLGIDLDGSDGAPTPNDPGDADTGANSLQNTAVLDSASSDDTQTTISGTVATTATTPIVVRLFASPQCDPSGTGEGERFLGSASLTTDGVGNAAFALTVPLVDAGQQVTATVTGPSGTSEFSQCRAVQGPAPGVATIAPAAATVAEGESAAFTVTRSGSTREDAIVLVRSADGSARAREDYDPLDTAVFFPAGESSRTVTLATRDDEAAEGDETLTVSLAEPVRVGLGDPASATVTIAGADREPDSDIARPPARPRRGQRLRLAGTASDPDGDLARVEVSIFEARAVRGSCRSVNARGRVVRRRSAGRRCAPAVFLRAQGTERWSLTLRSGLPRGSWVIVSRASDRARHRETRFDARDRNRAVVRVR